MLSLPFQDALVIDPFSPKDNYCLLTCLILCSDNWAWQPSGWGPSKDSQTEIEVALHLWLVPYRLLPAFKGSGSLFQLSLGVVLDLGREVSFAPSLGMPLAFNRLFNTARNIYCLSWPKPDKIFKRMIFF